MGVLARNGVGYRFFQRSDAVPLVGWTHPAVAADLIDAPIDFQRVIVGVAKLDGDLAAGAAAPFEIDSRAVGPQAVARPYDLGERGNLERQMVQLAIGISPLARAD